MSDVDFLLISDPKIWSMAVKDCGEPLVDLRDTDFIISTDRAEFYSGYTQVRATVAAKLMAARKQLPQGYDFWFSEGHRPLSVQDMIYQEYYNKLRSAHPDWSEDTLLIEVVKYVAPPVDVPPHSTGGAFDISLVDADGNKLDMGTVLDDTPDNNGNANFTYAPGLSPEAAANRQILIDVLSAQGFVNYPAEWWHWSYGDKYWAYHAEHPHALYASIE